MKKSIRSLTNLGLALCGIIWPSGIASYEFIVYKSKLSYGIGKSVKDGTSSWRIIH